jgi:hypothetical protein
MTGLYIQPRYEIFDHFFCLVKGSFPGKRVFLGGVLLFYKMGLGLFWGKYLNEFFKQIYLILQFSSLESAVGNVPGDEDRIIYIYTDKISYTNKLYNASEGEICPRKRVFFGGLSYRKWGLAFFLGLLS